MGNYQIADFIAYDRHAWYRLFEQVNANAWPAHLIVLLLAGTAAVVSVRAVRPVLRRGGKNKRSPVQVRYQWPMLLVLASVWAWVGWMFHWRHHQELNWAASYWAAAFAIEAAALLLCAAISPAARPGLAVPSKYGFALLIALVWPPLAGWLLGGRNQTALEWFGIAPDPTAWLTLLVLAPLVSQQRWLVLLLPIPLLSLAISFAFGWSLGAPDVVWISAPGVLVSVAALLWPWRRKSLPELSPEAGHD